MQFTMSNYNIMKYRQFLKYRLLAFAFFLTMCGIAGSSFAQGNSDRSEQGSRQVQVYDCIGNFLFSADDEREAREELKNYAECSS